jgi:hypothetical protein
MQALQLMRVLPAMWVWLSPIQGHLTPAWLGRKMTTLTLG